MPAGFDKGSLGGCHCGRKVFRMGTWDKRKNDITPRAALAARTMIQDRATGEAAFDALMVEFPGDGMVLLERGKAYEAIGETDLALADYLNAEQSFRMPRWKTIAHGKFAHLNAMRLKR